MNNKESILKDFLSRVIKTSDCWLWPETKTDGYGIVCYNSRTYRVHRLSFELFVGPIPDNLQVCHCCDNRECSNPSHLFLGTNKQNMEDRNKKGRTAKGEKHPKVKLTKVQVSCIRALIPAIRRKTLAQWFRVHETTIGSIKYGLSWRENVIA